MTAQFLALLISFMMSLDFSAHYGEATVTLLAVGDNLIHDVIYWQARQEDGSYDFSPLYSRVGGQIQSADIAFINQETPLVPDRAPSSYPMFNTPVEMAVNLRDAGFDILSLANNHMLDMGADGLKKTIETVRATDGLTSVGAYLNSDEHDNIPIIEFNGVKIAFLGFPEHTNGIPIPQGRDDMIIYTGQVEDMGRIIALARECADIVVVSVHWGQEGSISPSGPQKELARELSEMGADLIIGTHPHVLQPVEYITRESGGQTLVLYSLGNFVSAQIENVNLVSVMAEVTFTLDRATGAVSITYSLHPVVTHYEGSFHNLTVYPLEEYTDELASSHGVRRYGSAFSLAVIEGILNKTVGEL